MNPVSARVPHMLNKHIFHVKNECETQMTYTVPVKGIKCVLVLASMNESNKRTSATLNILMATKSSNAISQVSPGRGGRGWAGARGGRGTFLTPAMKHTTHTPISDEKKRCKQKHANVACFVQHTHIYTQTHVKHFLKGNEHIYTSQMHSLVPERVNQPSKDFLRPRPSENSNRQNSHRSTRDETRPK